MQGRGNSNDCGGEADFVSGRAFDKVVEDFHMAISLKKRGQYREMINICVYFTQIIDQCLLGLIRLVTKFT